MWIKVCFDSQPIFYPDSTIHHSFLRVYKHFLHICSDTQCSFLSTYAIYDYGTERTLLKLKQGSLRNPSIAVENSMGTDVNCTIASDSTEQEAMTIEGNFSSIDSLPVSSNCESTGTSKEQGTKSLSILCLFSRYKDSQQLSVSSSDD